MERLLRHWLGRYAELVQNPALAVEAGLTQVDLSLRLDVDLEARALAERFRVLKGSALAGPGLPGARV